MQENKIIIIIDKPIGGVFEFTTNPKNTPLWIPSIKEEICEEYPPKLGTIYKNKGGSSEWNIYKVIEFEVNKIFTLSDLKENYHVKYSYEKINDNKTRMEYLEWVKTGELEKPFTKDIIQKLKQVLETK